MQIPDCSKTGVYVIRNKITYKQYIGSTSKYGFKERIRRHRNALEKGTHCNRYLQAAWDKYGPDNFEAFIIYTCAPELCLRYEQLFITQQRSAEREFGYNLSPTAGSVKGVKFSEASRKKLSAVMNSEEIKAKISKANKGRRRTAEQRLTISKSLMGRKLSPQHRANIAKGLRKRYER